MLLSADCFTISEEMPIQFLNKSKTWLCINLERRNETTNTEMSAVIDECVSWNDHELLMCIFCSFQRIDLSAFHSAVKNKCCLNFLPFHVEWPNVFFVARTKVCVKTNNGCKYRLCFVYVRFDFAPIKRSGWQKSCVCVNKMYKCVCVCVGCVFCL